MAKMVFWEKRMPKQPVPKYERNLVTIAAPRLVKKGSVAFIDAIRRAKMAAIGRIAA